MRNNTRIKKENKKETKEKTRTGDVLGFGVVKVAKKNERGGGEEREEEEEYGVGRVV